MTEKRAWMAEWGPTHTRMTEKGVWLAEWDHTLKDDREKGVAERESRTKLAERKGYGWLNGGHTQG